MTRRGTERAGETGTSAGKPDPKVSKPPRRRFAPTAIGAALVLLAVALLLLTPLWTRSDATMADDDPPNSELKPAPIDGKRAYRYLTTICALGPRIAGTEANTKQREMVAGHFRAMGGQTFEQKFQAIHPLTGQKVEMVNLIGSWFPDRDERVLIAAHYDTRPHPDEDLDPIKRQGEFLGANDGASGVALLMEISHHLKDSPTPWGVDLILLDGEELMYGRTGEFFLGSKAFGAAYERGRKKKTIKYRYVAGMVLDMVGDSELTVPREPYSVKLAPRLVEDVWNVAQEINAEAFRPFLGREVLDDHLPLNDAGIPTIDIIDFDYPFWHTADDLPEHCSGDSLAQVGRVVTAWLNKPKPPSRRRSDADR